jgi:polysaccharide export outer membrane protein
VWKDEALTNKLLIRPDGKFSFPLIGEIQAKDRTVEAVRQEIESKIQEYVPNAPVVVILREINYPKIYVVGKVNKPGMFIMAGEPVSVLQALSLAGGMTSFADTGDIIVLRKSGETTKVFRFNYNKVSKGERLEQNIELKPGDTVVVP